MVLSFLLLFVLSGIRCVEGAAAATSSEPKKSALAESGGTTTDGASGTEAGGGDRLQNVGVQQQGAFTNPNSGGATAAQTNLTSVTSPVK
jgi:hypothetical protein